MKFSPIEQKRSPAASGQNWIVRQGEFDEQTQQTVIRSKACQRRKWLAE
jgi:hypothetical protein